MKEEIIQAMYTHWCETKGDFEPRVEEALEHICERMGASKKDALFIETELSNAVTASEKAAFYDGAMMAAELLAK